MSLASRSAVLALGALLGQLAGLSCREVPGRPNSALGSLPRNRTDTLPDAASEAGLPAGADATSALADADIATPDATAAQDAATAGPDATTTEPDATAADLGLEPDAGEPAAPPLDFAKAGLSVETTTGVPCSGTGSATLVLCVDARAADNGDGSAARPFSRIQDAVDAAQGTTIIQVAGGTYEESVRVNNKTVRLLGGFTGLGDNSTAPFDTTRAPARLISTISGSTSAPCVSLIQATGADVEGFRIRGGGGFLDNGARGRNGGGVFISEGSARILNNLLEDNDVTAASSSPTSSAGGGLFCESAEVRIEGNVIRNNRAGRGAVGVNGGKVVIVGNRIENNVAVGDHGGGLYLAGPELDVADNLIRGNVIQPQSGAGGWGGGLIAHGSETRISLTRNVVLDNHAPEIGSGEFIDDGAHATIRNELIATNRCGGHGSGLYVDGLDGRTRSTAELYNVTIAAHPCTSGSGHGIYIENSVVTVRNSIIWNNGGDDYYLLGNSSLSVSYTLSEEARAGTGNLSIDPRFADPSGDFHLQSTAGRWNGSWVSDERSSPAIDVGDPTTPVAAESAPNGGRINLGAYGGTAQASRSP